MTDLTNILGIALIGVGAASAVYGTILCYSVKVLRNCVHCTQFLLHMHSSEIRGLRST